MIIFDVAFYSLCDVICCCFETLSVSITGRKQ